jgi:alpha-tubulin suppressor-like RCC1 family protein
LSFDIIIKQISCGDKHACFISGEALAFSVGSNEDGQLGVGDMALSLSSAPLLIEQLPKKYLPTLIKCGGSHSAVILNNG